MKEALLMNSVHHSTNYILDDLTLHMPWHKDEEL